MRARVSDLADPGANLCSFGKQEPPRLPQRPSRDREFEIRTDLCEIGPGLLKAMLAQLGLGKRDLEI